MQSHPGTKSPKGSSLVRLAPRRDALGLLSSRHGSARYCSSYGNEANLQIYTLIWSWIVYNNKNRSGDEKVSSSQFACTLYIYCTCVCPHVIKLLVSQTVCPRNPRFCMLSCRVPETVDNHNMAKVVALLILSFFRNVLAKLNFWHIGQISLPAVLSRRKNLHFFLHLYSKRNSTRK